MFAPAFTNERLGYDGVWRVSHRIGISVGIDDAGQSKMAASDIYGVNFAALFINASFLFCVIREAQPSMVEMPLALGRRGPAAYNLDGEHRRI